METDDLKQAWDDLALEDPLWAVLTRAGKSGRRWDVDDFFNTGTREIAGVMGRMRTLDIDIPRRTALDFGCGVGRIAQALCRYFDRVAGVDISPEMVRIAETLNRRGRVCSYRCNHAPNLELFDDGEFDFVYSSITLQHMSPELGRCYLGEFLRLLSPNGMLVFQMPSHPARTLRGLAKESLPPWLLSHLRRRGSLYEPRIAMHCTPKRQIEDFLTGHGAVLLHVERDRAAGPSWLSYRYYVTHAPKTASSHHTPRPLAVRS
jgi:SAM-dependent methyltransferase